MIIVLFFYFKIKRHLTRRCWRLVFRLLVETLLYTVLFKLQHDDGDWLPQRMLLIMLPLVSACFYCVKFVLYFGVYCHFLFLVPPGLPQTTDGSGAAHTELQEDPAHLLPGQGDHSVPLHVPHCAGVSCCWVGLQWEDRGLVCGLG